MVGSDRPGAIANPAGVVPLVQAMGYIVAAHADAAYTTLAEDERLWTLIDLLQPLSRPAHAASTAREPSTEVDEEYSARDGVRTAGSSASSESSRPQGRWCSWRPQPDALNLAGTMRAGTHSGART